MIGQIDPGIDNNTCIIFTDGSSGVVVFKMQILELVGQHDRMLDLGCTLAEPHQVGSAVRVYLSHEIYLPTLLGQIVLIDANSIHPQRTSLVFLP